MQSTANGIHLTVCKPHLNDNNCEVRPHCVLVRILVTKFIQLGAVKSRLAGRNNGISTYV